MRIIEDLKQRRVLRTAAVYLVAAWGAIEVGATVLPLAGAPDWAPRLVLAVAAAGFPVVLALAWLYDLRRSPLHVERAGGDLRIRLGQALVMAAATVVGLAIPTFILLDRHAEPSDGEVATPAAANTVAGASAVSRDRTVAVMPFRTAASQVDDVYFADGVTDELVSVLASIDGLRVLSRAAAARLMADGALPRDVGERLGAGFLLEGSVRRDGPTVRVSASLTRTETGEVTWSDDFNRDLTVESLFAVQEEVARAVAAELNARIAPDRARLARAPTGDVDAFDHYLRGAYELFRRTPASLTRAIAEFRAASDLDPGFTAALAREAYAYALFVDWGWIYPGATSEQLLERSARLADRALARDSTSAEAWLAFGYAQLLHDAETPARALPAFERALELNPSDAETFHQYGQTLMSLGRYNEAASAYHGALALDPTRAMTLVPLAAMSQRIDPAEARRWIDSAVVVGPEVPYAWSYRAHIRNAAGDHLGALADARHALAVDPSYAVPAHSALAVGAHGMGRDEEAAAHLERALASPADPERPGSTDALYLGGALVALGRTAEALDLLERVPPTAWLWFYMQNPAFDPIRDDASFQALVAASAPPGTSRKPAGGQRLNTERSASIP